jgi:hypothetical protein
VGDYVPCLPWCSQTQTKQLLENRNNSVDIQYIVKRSTSVLVSGQQLVAVLTISCNSVLCPVLVAGFDWNCDEHVSLFGGRTGPRRTGVSCLVRLLIIISILLFTKRYSGGKTEKNEVDRLVASMGTGGVIQIF